MSSGIGSGDRHLSRLSAPGAKRLRDLTLAGLDTRAEAVVELGQRFVATGHELALVGGCVRDLLTGRPGDDIDLTTDAPPEVVIELLRGWADNIWEVGIKFGTVGATHAGLRYEITTYRSESYEAQSRKPAVVYGSTLSEDLRRRDFTINAMAMRLPDFEFIDEHGGLADLTARIIRTPAGPQLSFGDDPLRMMRAARFASQLGFTVEPSIVAAMREMAPRLEIVSAERIRDEFSKLLLTASPRAGLELLVETGLAEIFLPELPALRLETDEHHHHKDVYQHSLTVMEQAIALEQSHQPQSEPDLVLRLAALLHDIGKPKTRRFERGGTVSFHHHEVVGAKLVRRRLQKLRYPRDVVNSVTALVGLHLRFHGYSAGEWTDAAIRRYVRDADDELVRLHKLTRADCTTRNRRKAEALQLAYSQLETRIGELCVAEELSRVRPDLDGNQIMEILGLPPGREVGLAYKYLLERRLDRGPVERAVAEAELVQWWAKLQSGESSAGQPGRIATSVQDGAPLRKLSGTDK